MVAVLSEHAGVASEFQAAIGRVPDLERLLVKSVTLLTRFQRRAPDFQGLVVLTAYGCNLSCDDAVTQRRVHRNSRSSFHDRPCLWLLADAGSSCYCTAKKGPHFAPNKRMRCAAFPLCEARQCHTRVVCA